jgi:hypothetical protein
VCDDAGLSKTLAHITGSAPFLISARQRRKSPAVARGIFSLPIFRFKPNYEIFKTIPKAVFCAPRSPTFLDRALDFIYPLAQCLP